MLGLTHRLDLEVGFDVYPGRHERYRLAEMAARAGVAASSLRIYERAGLLSPARQAENGYLVSDESALEELAFIQRAKGIGISLEASPNWRRSDQVAGSVIAGRQLTAPAHPWFLIKEVADMRYRLVVRVTAADIGQRVAIRWRPAELDDSKLMTDVLGILEEADDQFFKVRRGRDGQLVVIPRERALAGKVVPPAPPPRRPRKAPGSS